MSLKSRLGNVSGRPRNKPLSRLSDKVAEGLHAGQQRLQAGQKQILQQKLVAAHKQLAPLINAGKGRAMMARNAAQAASKKQNAMRAFERDRGLIGQAANVCRQLNAPGMPEWIASHIFAPMGSGALSADDAMDRLDQKIGSPLQPLSRSAASHGYWTLTMRTVGAAVFGVGVEFNGAFNPGLVTGALLHEDEYQSGYCWAGAVRMSTTIQATIGIEFALWKRKPDNLTGWFEFDYTFRLAGILGVAASSYVRGQETIGWAVGPIGGAAVDMERFGEDFGAGGIVVLIPEKLAGK